MSDSLVQKQPNTVRDFVCLIAVGLPIVLLAGVVIWAMAAWQMKSGQLRQRLESQGGPDLVSLANAYDQKMSREMTSKVNRIVAAAESISNEIETDFGYAESFVPWSEFPPKEFFSECARQGKPVFEQLEALLSELPSTWQAREFKNRSWSAGDFTSSRGLQRLVQCECIDAIHQSELERAIRAFKVLPYIESSCRQHVSNSSLHARAMWIDAMSAIIIATLQRDVWSADQLKQLESVFAQPDQIQQFVADLNPYRHGAAYQVVNRDYSSPYYFNGQARSMQKIAIAPSEQLALLSTTALPSFAQLNNGDLDPEYFPAAEGMDQILQIPFANVARSRKVDSYDLRLLSAQMIQMEAVRMAIAIKRFKKTLNRYPADLDELIKIGATPCRSRDVRYRVGDTVDGDTGSEFRSASVDYASHNPYTGNTYGSIAIP